MTFALTHFFHAHTHVLALWTAGRRKATQELVKLLVYAAGHEGDDEPLLEEPITVHKRVRVAGEDSGQYLCQLNNSENRAFRELFQGQYDEGTFPSTGFCVQQDEYFSWMHVVRGDKESLTSYYDFVEVADE